MTITWDSPTAAAGPATATAPPPPPPAVPAAAAPSPGIKWDDADGGIKWDQPRAFTPTAPPDPAPAALRPPVRTATSAGGFRIVLNPRTSQWEPGEATTPPADGYKGAADLPQGSPQVPSAFTLDPVPTGPSAGLTDALTDHRGILARGFDAWKAANPFNFSNRNDGSASSKASAAATVLTSGMWGASPRQGVRQLYDQAPANLESVYGSIDPYNPNDAKTYADYLAAHRPADLTPEGEQAADLAAKGYNNLTPDDQKRFHSLMRTAFFKRWSMNDPAMQQQLAGSIAAQSGGVQAASDNLWNAVGKYTGLNTPEQDQIAAAGAQQHPAMAMGGRALGTVLNVPTLAATVATGGAADTLLASREAALIANGMSPAAAKVAVRTMGASMTGAAVNTGMTTADAAAQGRLPTPGEVAKSAGVGLAYGPVSEALHLGAGAVPGVSSAMESLPMSVQQGARVAGGLGAAGLTNAGLNAVAARATGEPYGAGDFGRDVGAGMVMHAGSGGSVGDAADPTRTPDANPIPAAKPAPAPFRDIGPGPSTPEHVASFGDQAAAQDYAKQINGVAVADATGRGYHVLTMPAGAETPKAAQVSPPAPQPDTTASPMAAEVQQRSDAMKGSLTADTAALSQRTQNARDTSDFSALMDKQRSERIASYTPDRLSAMNGTQLRAAADDAGVAYDAPSTTIPRILDQVKLTQLDTMSNRDLFNEARRVIDENQINGVRAGNREQNMRILRGWYEPTNRDAPPAPSASAKTSTPLLPSTDTPLPHASAEDTPATESIPAHTRESLTALGQQRGGRDLVDLAKSAGVKPGSKRAMIDGILKTQDAQASESAAAAARAATIPPGSPTSAEETANGRSAAIPERRNQNPEVAQGAGGGRGGAFEGQRIAGPAGKSAALIFGDGSQRPLTYRAVEADDLIPSHDARRNFAPNPAGDTNERPYDDPVQGRDSRQTVESIAAKPNPALLTTDTPTAVDGPPITTPTGQVLGGNARSMAMQLAYSRGGEPAQTIRQGMIDAAGKFGLNPQDVSGLKNPVIVRELSDPGTKGQLSRALNESMTTGKTSATDAASRAARISPGSADAISAMLSSGDGRSVRDMLADPRAAQDVVHRFVKDGVWTQADATKYLDPRTHALNEDGKAVIERTLLGRVIDDPSVLGSISPAVRTNLVSALGDITRLARDPATDIRPQLKAAVDAFNGWKRSGMSLSDYFFDQASLMPPAGFGDMQTALLAHALDEMGPRQFKSAMANFRSLSAPEKGGLLGDAEPVDKTRAMWDAFGKDMKGPGVVRAAKALGLPVKDEPAAGKSLFGPGAAATNDPNFQKENPGTIPPPPDAPRTAGTDTKPKAPAAQWIDRITAGVRSGLDSAKRYTGKFLPTTSRLNPAAAEAAAEYMSAPEIAQAQKALAVRRVLGEQPVGSTLDRLVNSVILEDGLRGDRARLQDRQVQAKREYDAAVAEVQQAKAFNKFDLTPETKAAKIEELKADYLKKINKLGAAEEQVKTIIGDPSHELPTEEAYEAAKNNPEVQRALTAHRSYVMPESEAYYRAEAHIADDTDVPVRGADTGTYLTRKAIRDDDAGGPVAKAGTRQKSSGLTREAKGNAAQYANTYSENVAHQFDRQTLPALQAKYFKALVDGGDAVMGKPGTAPRDPKTGQPWKGYDVKIGTNVLMHSGEPSFLKSRSEQIFVRPELAKEFERVTNTANNVQSGPFKHAADFGNSIAMMSTAEPAAHLVNHISKLLQMMVYKGPNQGLLSKVGIGEANLANVPIIGRGVSMLERVGGKLVGMAMHDPRVLAQELEAAKVAGLQPENQVKQSAIGKLVGMATFTPSLADHPAIKAVDPTYWVSRGVGAFTKASRLVGLDAFHAAVDAGAAKDTPLNKAQFLSQFTQYHHEAQPQLISLFRKLGLGPFASAANNFLIQRYKGLIGSPNFEATSTGQAVRARATTAAVAWGGLMAVGLANYAMWGAFKPAGTPTGSIVYGKTDDGRFKYINVAQWNGLRAAGVSQFADAALDHATLQQAIDKGAAGTIQGFAAPYIGPALRAGIVGATGRELPTGQDVAGRIEPGSGETQTGRNITTALRELNPAVGTLTDDRPDAAGPTKLLGAFAPRVGRDPENVPASRAEALAAQMAGGKLNDAPETPDSQQKAALKGKLVDQLKAANRTRTPGDTAPTDAEKAVQDAVDSGKLTQREGADIIKRAGMSPISWHLRTISPNQAAQVYDAGTLEEKAGMHDQVRDKIVKSPLSPADQDNLMNQHGITPPPDLDLHREYQGLEKRQTADEKRTQQSASLIRQINAARVSGDTPKMDQLRQQRTDLMATPPALTGADKARYEQLKLWNQRANQINKQVQEGSIAPAEGQRRLGLLRRATVR